MAITTKRTPRTTVSGTEDRSGPPLDIVRLSSISPQPVEWLWDGRIPLGKLSIWMGDPGVGKSVASLDVAARVSKGEPWPNASAIPQPAGDVLLFSAEDDAADTILPRLNAAGANCERIRVVMGANVYDDGVGYKRSFDLCRDVQRLREEIEPGTKLIIFDPLSAFMGGSDTHKDSEVRAVLAELAELAAEKNVAIVCVSHMRKGAGTAIYRAMGSLAFVAAARAVWVFAKDPKEATRRLMLSVKNNLAPDDLATGLSFTVEGDGESDAAVVRWSDKPVEISAEEALSIEPTRRGRPAESRNAAVEWLQTVLADGSQPQKMIESQAEEAGFSWSTVVRAKSCLRIKSHRPGGKGAWLWMLPSDSDDLPSFVNSKAA